MGFFAERERGGEREGERERERASYSRARESINSHEHRQILATIQMALTHVERFDHLVVNGTRDSFVQVVINLSQIEFGLLKRRNYFPDLLRGPTAVYNHCIDQRYHIPVILGMMVQQRFSGGEATRLLVIRPRQHTCFYSSGYRNSSLDHLPQNQQRDRTASDPYIPAFPELQGV